MLTLANELTTKMVLNCTLNDVVAHYTGDVVAH